MAWRACDCVWGGGVCAGVKNAFRKLIIAERERTNLPAPLPLPLPVASRLCALFQETVLDHLRDKLEGALQHIQVDQEEGQGQEQASTSSPGRGITSPGGGALTSLVVVGGVASNQQLRR